MKAMDLQPAIDLLAQHSSKVSTSTEYRRHLHARLATMETMKKYVKAKAPGGSSATGKNNLPLSRVEQGSFFGLYWTLYPHMVSKTSSEDARSINTGNIRARMNTLYGLFILVDSQSRVHGILSPRSFESYPTNIVNLKFFGILVVVKAWFR